MAASSPSAAGCSGFKPRSPLHAPKEGLERLIRESTHHSRDFGFPGGFEGIELRVPRHQGTISIGQDRELPWEFLMGAGTWSCR